MRMRRVVKSYQVSEQTARLIEEMGVLLDVANAAVLARAVGELACRLGLAVVPEDAPRRRRYRPYSRQVADPPGPIHTKYDDDTPTHTKG